jgi:hypothetical protein
MYQLSFPQSYTTDHYDLKYFAAGSPKEILNQANKDVHDLIVNKKKPVIVFVDSYYNNMDSFDTLSRVA